MPTYVYKFVETGETIEVQQAFTDDALTEAVHPATGATMTVKKVFQPVGVTFKGGGFYKTDSRGGSAKTSASSTTPASSDSGASTGGSSSESSSSTSSSTPATPAATPAATTSPAS
jgi:predicted nucleic acid-binding Zn ribbon protein